MTAAVRAGMKSQVMDRTVLVNGWRSISESWKGLFFLGNDEDVFILEIFTDFD